MDQTPFLSISLDGDISLAQNSKNSKIMFQQTDEDQTDITWCRNYDKEWEKSNDIELPRKWSHNAKNKWPDS